MFFLRYTNSPEEDLNRNASFHASGISKDDSTIESMSEAFDCDEESIVLLDNGLYANGIPDGDVCYFQKLDGLCGFQLESNNLDDAINEAHKFRFNGVYNSEDMNSVIVIFKGSFIESNQEGCLFDAKKIVYKK